jgi:uncharacterized protein (TIGR03000 family)
MNPNGQSYMSGYYAPNSGTLPTWSDVNQRSSQQLPAPQQRSGQGIYSDQPGRTNELTPNPQGGTTPPQNLNRPMPQARANLERPATIVVRLPVNARLMIEGQPTQSMSGERVFVSPPLEPGKTYSYNLKAEIDRNGEKATTTQSVDVRAGETSRVALNFPTPDAGK